MSSISSYSRRIGWVTLKLGCLAGALICTSHSVIGGVNADGMATPDGKTTATTEEQAPEYNNWIEFAFGGITVDGDRAQFEQEHHLPANQVYGGIQDMHIEGSNKDVQFVLDGHAIFDTNDYGLRLQLTKNKVGYIAFGYDAFRTWYDGNAGYFPPNGKFFNPPVPEMHIDRGDVWVELGLRIPDWPEITLRYSHDYRQGMKDSTMWGDTNLTGIGVTRKIAPAFRHIDETRDSITFDLSKTFGNTDVLLGMRYEHDSNDDSLNIIRGAGQLPPVVPPPGQQRWVTQHQKDDVDFYTGHAIAETRFSDSLWFTMAYSYTTFTNDLSGSRLPGLSFDAAFGEPVPTLGSRDHSFIDLAGTAEIDQHVVNANLYWTPVKDLDILGGFRYTHDKRDSDSAFLALEPTPNVAPFTNNNPEGGYHLGTPEPGVGFRSSDYDRFGQSIEMRYGGLSDWLIYARGDWEEEWGSVNELQSIDEAEVPLDKNTDSLRQKYTFGVNWYPLMRLTLSSQYYHQISHYHDDISAADFPRLINQDWNTDDVNLRINFRPKLPLSWGSLSFVTRYDYIRTSIDSQWGVFPDAVILDHVESGLITKHVISESINWSPVPRFYWQADVSYVLDETKTPASNINLQGNNSPTVVNFRNDYWALSSGASYIIDDKTDVHADYSFFRATDYLRNALVAVPYGLTATEHVASATLTRQLNKQVSLQFRYTYYNYSDETYGGHNNYRGHSFFSSLRFRF
jgi:hypothetical protein